MNIKKLFKMHYLLAVLLLIATVSISEAAKGDKEVGKRFMKKNAHGAMDGLGQATALQQIF